MSHYCRHGNVVGRCPRNDCVYPPPDFTGYDDLEKAARRFTWAAIAFVIVATLRVVHEVVRALS